METKTVLVSDLSGAALDWAVAKCEGYFDDTPHYKGSLTVPMHFLQMWKADGHGVHWTHSSTDWAEGGPIIERNDISFRKYHNPNKESHGTYYARICRESGTFVYWYKASECQNTGETPLIASMRCYVEYKLGKTVEVPVDLLGE